MHRPIYLDHAASTPLAPEVIDALVRHMGEFGNPSSRHRPGEEARELVERARARVARLVNAAPEEVVFTGSGTEADNLAIQGIAFAHPHRIVARAAGLLPPQPGRLPALGPALGPAAAAGAHHHLADRALGGPRLVPVPGVAGPPGLLPAGRWRRAGRPGRRAAPAPAEHPPDLDHARQ